MERFVAEFARHRDRLFAYVYSLLPRREDAEDVFQRTSVVLWQKVGTWETGVDFLRVSGRDRLRFGDALLERLAQERAATLATRDERVAALDGCLRALDAAERELVRRAYGDDVSVRALAGESGKAAQTLYNRLNQIRRKLFECVAFKTSEART